MADSQVISIDGSISAALISFLIFTVTRKLDKIEEKIDMYQSKTLELLEKIALSKR
jgi:hypothetical protein